MSSERGSNPRIDMPLLVYCIAEAAIPIELPNPAVQRKNIETISEAGLRCFISAYDNPGSDSKQLVREAALAFNCVIQEILKQAAIIPFRFPTLYESESEISSFLRDHSAEYHEALSRLKESIQMELQISLNEQDNPKEIGKESGSQYLRHRQAKHQKLESTADVLHRSLSEYVQCWRQRATASGMRCYVLVGRDLKQNFLVQAQSAIVPEDVVVRITGPWPASEFIKVNGEDGER
jgi:hypothetical protein